jgi:hypothetical protein
MNKSKRTAVAYETLAIMETGVFRNSGEAVASWFAHHILNNEVFKSAFANVVFAVYEAAEKGQNFNAFKNKFEYSEIQ